MNSINEDLIKKLKSVTPRKGETVALLMEIISIGKEAAYRRLRGEIPFSLEEAVEISRKLGISLDILSGTKQEDIFTFHLNAAHNEDPVKGYHRMITQIIKAMEAVRKDPKSFSCRAYRALPQEFIFKYASLSRIYIYVLLYQLNNGITPKELLSIKIPEELFSIQKKAASSMQTIDSIVILDKKAFIDYIEIAKYFHTLGIITHEDIAHIKRDILLMINDLEKCASTGLTIHKKKIDIYICHISFDCTYTYVEGANLKASSVGVYCVDHLSCINPEICEKHKSWIKALIRFSSLISVSGELLRKEYFQNQRQIVESML